MNSPLRYGVFTLFTLKTAKTTNRMEVPPLLAVFRSHDLVPGGYAWLESTTDFQPVMVCRSLRIGWPRINPITLLIIMPMQGGFIVPIESLRCVFRRIFDHVRR